MSHEHDLSRLHNPWEKFTHRDEKKHNAENDLTFRLGRPPYQSVLPQTPQPLSTNTTTEVIELFLDYGSKSLDDPVPRQRQLLKDFLQASNSPLPSLSSLTPTTTYIDDVNLRSSVGDIALIDDRNYHPYCARKIKQQTCSDCYIHSKKLAIPELCTHLQGEVSYVIYADRGNVILTFARTFSERLPMVMRTEGYGKPNINESHRMALTCPASYPTSPQLER
jgi:hypothetical protein